MRNSGNLQKELQEQSKATEEEGEYVRKLEGLLTKFGEEVKRVKELEKEILAPKENSSKILGNTQQVNETSRPSIVLRS